MNGKVRFIYALFFLLLHPFGKSESASSNNYAGSTRMQGFIFRSRFPLTLGYIVRMQVLAPKVRKKVKCMGQSFAYETPPPAHCMVQYKHMTRHTPLEAGRQIQIQLKD
jgi:hypothetical protein